MSPAEVAAVRAYLAPISPAWWAWDADHSAIAWRDGPTITVRQELAIALSSQAKQGLPPLSAVLILLSACRDSWPESRTVLTNIVQSMSDAGMYLPAWTGELFTSLDRLHSVSRTQLQSPQRKADLLAYLFENQGYLASASAVSGAVVKLLAAPGPVSQLDDIPPTPFDLWKIVGTLRGCLQDFDPQVFESWVKTGLTQSVQPAEVELTAGERVRAMLQQLNDHPELGGVARLARQLLAAITLPRPLAEPDDLPLGGVSDITNRGSLDRLLLSELAHDDLTLAVRIAMNEALYYRRETPPRSPPLRRMIVIDSGLRTWGVPRLFTTAVGLALSAAGDEQLAINTFRASGDKLLPIDLTQQTGLAEHLAALETDLHLGQALPAIEKDYAQATTPSDVVLITSDDALADEDFRQKLRTSNLHGAWIATINRAGRFRLLEFGLREMVLKREATFDLKAILTPPKRAPAPLRAGTDTRPAFCRMNRAPLRVPHDLSIGKVWEINGQQALALFKDGRLTWWSDTRFAPQILAKNMPSRARLLWADGRSGQPPFCAIVGTMANRGLRALQVWPETGQVICTPLAHDYADVFTVIHATAEHIFLIGPQRVTAFAWSGEELATSTAFRHHIQGPYFYTSDRFIGGIHCDGARIGLTSGYSTPIGTYGKVIAVMGPPEAPQGLTNFGQFVNLITRQVRDFVPADFVRPCHVRQLARNGNRAIIGNRDGKQLLIVLDENRCLPCWGGDPTGLLEPGVERFLGRQVNVRLQFRGICLTTQGELALVSKKGQELTLSLRSLQLQLHSTGRSQQRPPTLRLFAATEETAGYQLQRATWPDGSEAWLDSRGLLHLRSSNREVPEMSFVLYEGHTAGWTADGEAFGNNYFVANANEVNPRAAVRQAYQAFVASLVTVEIA